jgi:peptide/nickel transport system ATP-binding protein
VSGLTVDFASPRGPVRTVMGVDLSLRAGETLVLLGESGSGKSVSLRALLRLLPKTAQIGGSINVAGHDVLALSARDLTSYRGRTVAMVFQDPGLAFDPVYRVGDQIAEAVMRHEGCGRAEGRARALELFELVRIPSPKLRLDVFPHEMSGGMRQRAMIALALSCRPQVLLADEPTTALDATVQIQVLLLMRDLQQKLGLGVIFVTHDVGVAAEVADHVAVMYAGRIVETGPALQVLRYPKHPYTQALLKSRAATSMDKSARLPSIKGAPPDPANLPRGCSFAPRCSHVAPACMDGVPALEPVGDDHHVRCIAVARVSAAIA